MLRKVALSVEYCTPSSVTCTTSIELAPCATDGHVTILAECEKVAALVPATEPSTSNRQP
jgi:hypothetical protein